MAISRSVSTLHQLLWEHHRLDIHAARFDPIFRQFFFDVLECALLDRFTSGDEADRGHALQLVAKMVTHRGLQHLVDEVRHASNHGDDIRSLGVWNVNLHLQINREVKTLTALCLNLLQLRIKIVRLRNNIGPVQRDDKRRHNDGLVAARIDRVLSRSQRLLPDAAMAGPHEAAELEFNTRRILRRETDVRFHHGNLTLLDDQHGHFFDSDQKRVEVIRAVQQGVVLQPDLAAQLQKLLKILIGAVLVILVAQNGLDESRVCGGARASDGLQRFDIFESAQAARDITSRQGLAFQRRDDTHHVEDSSGLGWMRRDSGDFELPFFEPERLVRERAFLLS